MKKAQNKKSLKKKQSSLGKSKLADECLLEIDGNVYITEKKNGKIISREPIDGTVVLKCLLFHLEQGLKKEIKKVG